MKLLIVVPDSMSMAEMKDLGGVVNDWMDGGHRVLIINDSIKVYFVDDVSGFEIMRQGDRCIRCDHFHPENGKPKGGLCDTSICNFVKWDGDHL